MEQETKPRELEPTPAFEPCKRPEDLYRPIVVALARMTHAAQLIHISEVNAVDLKSDLDWATRQVQTLFQKFAPVSHPRWVFKLWGWHGMEDASWHTSQVLRSPIYVLETIRYVEDTWWNGHRHRIYGNLMRMMTYLYLLFLASLHTDDEAVQGRIRERSDEMLLLIRGVEVVIDDTVPQNQSVAYRYKVWTMLGGFDLVHLFQNVNSPGYERIKRSLL